MTPDTKTRLKKLIPLLGSDNDGEVVATVRAIKRVLISDKTDFIDLGNSLAENKPNQSLQIQQQNMTIESNNRLISHLRWLLSAKSIDLVRSQQQIIETNKTINSLKNDISTLKNENIELKKRRITIDFSGLKHVLFWGTMVVIFLYLKGK